MPRIENGRFYPLTAIDADGDVVGHLIIRYPREEDESAVRFCFVILNPATRGNGLGKELIRLAIEYAKEQLNAARIELAVFENNESARRCYEAAGFTAYAESEYKMPIGTWNCTDMELHIGGTR